MTAGVLNLSRLTRATTRLTISFVNAEKTARCVSIGHPARDRNCATRTKPFCKKSLMRIEREETRHSPAAPSFGSISGTRSALDKRHPISTPRAQDVLDYKFVAGIHGTYVDFLVWKDDENSVFHIDDYLLLALNRLVCEFFKLPKEWFSTPSHRVAWIDVNRKQIALHAPKHFAFVGAPLRAQHLPGQPTTIKIAALGWPAFVDGASATPRRAMRAPYANRLVECVNPEEFATQRAVTATSPGHQLNHLMCIV
jgi:hypothetical protein